jgi:hypothetical protein
LLAHGPELAAIQARTTRPRGLGFVPPETKNRWRAVTLAVSPLVFLAYGLVHRLWRRRPLVSEAS